MTLANTPVPTTLNFTDTSTSTPIEQTAVIDTGTTLFYAPQSVVAAFYAAIPGAIQAGTIDPSLNGYYAIPCASTVNARIKFSDTVEMAFPATNLMWLSLEAYRPGYCVTSFVSTTSLSSFNSKFIGPNPVPSPKLPGSPDSEDDPNALAPASQPSWLLGDAFMKSGAFG